VAWGWCMTPDLDVKQTGISLIMLVGLVLGPDVLAFYHATAGRWLSRDPIEEKGGPNSYASLANDAVRRTDMLGQYPNPSRPDPGPPNRITTPPTGSFPKCRIALECAPTFSGVDHCGLVIDTGNGVYGLHGSGGTFNWWWLTPASPSDATGSWTDNPSSACECLFANITSWNGLNVPRDTLCANSNWNLKCALQKCSPQIEWGSQKKPLGFNCMECIKSGSRIGGDPTMSSTMCCLEWREKPCPGQ
jgi:hypothetical protein